MQNNRPIVHLNVETVGGIDSLLGKRASHPSCEIP